MGQTIKYAVIGGSGFYEPGLLADAVEIMVNTPYGIIKPMVGRLQGIEVAFLPRHGAQHSVLPHQINYLANIWGLSNLGVKRIIATNAVGCLEKDIEPGAIVISDQFIDFTKKRPLSFYEEKEICKSHVDITEPYCQQIRSYLKDAAIDLRYPYHYGGCYVCVEGPRYETAAEIKMFKMLGGTVIGMTGVPEVVLARELGICYANMSIVTNWAAGVTDQGLDHKEVLKGIDDNKNRLRTLIANALLSMPEEFACQCGINNACEKEG